MKYILTETFFGYLFRPILLWNIQDILIVLLEIALIWLWWGNVKSLMKSVKKHRYLVKRYKREMKKMKMRGEL